MPGALKPDAQCPKCSKDLLAVVRTTQPSSDQGALGFLHNDETDGCEVFGNLTMIDALYNSLCLEVA